MHIPRSKFPRRKPLATRFLHTTPSITSMVCMSRPCRIIRLPWPSNVCSSEAKRYRLIHPDTLSSIQASNGLPAIGNDVVCSSSTRSSIDNECCYIFGVVKACSFCLYTAMKIRIGEKAKSSLSQAVDESSIASLHSIFKPADDYLSRLKIRSEPETAIHWSISLYVHLRLLVPIQ